MRALLALSAVTLAACQADAWTPVGQLTPATAPYSPDATGSDSPDRACTVVLREAARLSN